MMRLAITAFTGHYNATTQGDGFLDLIRRFVDVVETEHIFKQVGQTKQ